MIVTIVGEQLPGRVFCEPDGTPIPNVHVGLQVRAEPEGLVPGDADTATWHADVRVETADDGAIDFKGPAVHGRRDGRFMYLTWGNVNDDGSFHMFRRAKLMLADVSADLIRQAETDDARLLATVRLTDERGGPRCARVGPSAVTWTCQPAG